MAISDNSSMKARVRFLSVVLLFCTNLCIKYPVSIALNLLSLKSKKELFNIRRILANFHLNDATVTLMKIIFIWIGTYCSYMVITLSG